MTIQPVEVGRVLLKEIHQKQDKIKVLTNTASRKPEIYIRVENNNILIHDKEAVIMINLMIDLLINQVEDLKREFKKL